jgi:hypothetical protein
VWKEAVVGLILRYYSRIFLEGLRETTRNHRIAGLQAEILNWDLLNMKLEC